MFLWQLFIELSLENLVISSIGIIAFKIEIDSQFKLKNQNNLITIGNGIVLISDLCYYYIIHYIIY